MVRDSRRAADIIGRVRSFYRKGSLKLELVDPNEVIREMVVMADDGQVLISVTDAGVGLPAGKEDQIFNAFFTTKPRGTGLGLATTRSIVESHGGRVWATANSGRGATFQFTLPQHRAAHT